jgi:hypothetical protein
MIQVRRNTISILHVSNISLKKSYEKNLKIDIYLYAHYLIKNLL